MKKVDSNNGVWINDDPATLTNGTPIDADVMNNIQDEISNVIIENGETLDGTNHSQLSQTLNKNFAKLNSPTLIGIPLTSNPDGTINNQIATVDYVNQKALQATVGFTPVQQSGGTDQGANKIYVGADKTDATQVRIQIDQNDIGKVVFQEENNDTYGIKQIGYNHTSNFISTLDSNNNYHNIHTADYIDSKQWISSLPDSNNLKVSDIIWNYSSSLPALYYGSDNSVAYLATQDWVSSSYITGNSGAPATSLNTGVIDNNSQSPSFRDGSGNWHVLQPYGDYATNTALSGGLATKQPTGNYAKTDASNTFQQDQNFSGYLNVSNGKSLVTNSPDNSIRVFRYTDNSGLATTDLNRASDGVNLSWFRLYQDGMLRTNIGDVVFRNNVDWGTINGGYYIRIGNVTTQTFTVAFPNGQGFINFPAQFSQKPQVSISSTDDAGNSESVIANVRHNTVQNNGFNLFAAYYAGGNSGISGSSTITIIATGVL